MALVIEQEDIVKLVGFRLGPKLFGADILNVREILRDPQIDTISGVPEFVEGIVRIRGQVLPIIRLGRILGVTAAPAAGEKLWILVAQAGTRNVGYIVDSVTPIIRIRSDAILPAPDLILAGLRGKYIKGVSETDKGLLVLVDLDHMLVNEEVNVMNKMLSQ